MRNVTNWTKIIAKFLGFSLISSILAGTLAVLFTIGIGIITAHGVSLANFSALHGIQREMYIRGIRDIWQYQSDCVDVGGNLIYQPKIGECFHSGIEFSNTLTFDEDGRVNTFSHDPYLPSIAVLGDSHAMGWGVDDDNTFSAELQRISNRRVYNLGVASYATERELDRLALMQNINSIDTVIIQYCDNDLSANRKYPIDRNLASERFNNAMHSYNSSQDSAVFRNFFAALKSLVPSFIKSKIKTVLKLNANAPTSTDENQHRYYIEKILAEYSEILKDKQVYVIFISGNNSIPVPKNWVGNFRERGLSVSFIDLNMQLNHFYSIDDHLNEHGHEYIASQIKALLDGR